MQKGFIQLIAIAIISAFLAAGVSILYQQSYPSIIEPEIPGILGVNTAVGGKVYTLSGAGISSSATSIPLTSFQIAGGTQPLLMADFGDLGCGTIQPGNSTRQEFISFTGVTQNSDGTATLTGVIRGLAPIPSYTASTTLQYSHAGGSQFVISNSPPCFYEGYVQAGNNDSITGLWNFNPIPIGLGSATSSNQFATRSYVDGVAIQGAATSTFAAQGISELALDSELCVGTASSTSGNPLVIPNLWSRGTSTPSMGCRTVITQTDGKISKSFFGEILATSTVSATSSIGVLNVGQINATNTTNQIGLNGITYSFPGTQTASSSVLSTNGEGSLTWEIPGFMEIASTTLSAAASSIDLSNIPERNQLKIIFSASSVTSASTRFFCRFNNDSGADNHESILIQTITSTLTGESSTTDAIGIQLFRHGQSPDTVQPLFTFDIANFANAVKPVVFSGGFYQAGSVYTVNGFGAYKVTAGQINRFTCLTSTTATMPAGTKITVYGSAR